MKNARMNNCLLGRLYAWRGRGDSQPTGARQRDSQALHKALCIRAGDNSRHRDDHCQEGDEQGIGIGSTGGGSVVMSLLLRGQVVVDLQIATVEWRLGKNKMGAGMGVIGASPSTPAEPGQHTCP
jgi:hypothetical protein